jgi:alpha-ketoglutarate-dependent taurine dioxygenase
VLSRVPIPIREKFERLGWMLVRNFGTGLGLSWEQAFGTKDRGAVERYCAESGIACEWLSSTRLRTLQRRRAIVAHPHTREKLWFNHSVFFHVSTVSADAGEDLLSMIPIDELPYNTYYGDGSEIEPEVLQTIRRAYVQEMVSFRWRQRDLLLLDNMLVAHARSSFKGPRKILVAMTQPCSTQEIE